MGAVMHETDEIRVLDHGFVRLDGCMADDLSVVNGARVSFAQRSDEMTDREAGLIRFLMRERHGSPVRAQRVSLPHQAADLRHPRMDETPYRVFNEWSGRYSQLEAEFYVPAPEDVRTQVGKPGSYSFEPVEPELAEHTREAQEAVFADAYRAYQDLLERGVAKEIARNVLPVAIYTQFYWTVNARSLMNFLSLRNSETAQREIRRYAEAVEDLFAAKMPVTHAAFVANDRRAP